MNRLHLIGQLLERVYREIKKVGDFLAKYNGYIQINR